MGKKAFWPNCKPGLAAEASRSQHRNESWVLFFQCCDRKARAGSAQSFTLWQQAAMEITRRDHSIVACQQQLYMGAILHAHHVHDESHIQCHADGEVETPAK